MPNCLNSLHPRLLHFWRNGSMKWRRWCYGERVARHMYVLFKSLCRHRGKIFMSNCAQYIMWAPETHPPNSCASFLGRGSAQTSHHSPLCPVSLVCWLLGTQKPSIREGVMWEVGRGSVQMHLRAAWWGRSVFSWTSECCLPVFYMHWEE